MKNGPEHESFHSSFGAADIFQVLGPFKLSKGGSKRGGGLRLSHSGPVLFSVNSAGCLYNRGVQCQNQTFCDNVLSVLFNSTPTLTLLACSLRVNRSSAAR